MQTDPLAFFAICLPGFEAELARELTALGLRVTSVTPGGVELSGQWPDIWAANLGSRMATRILVRIATFMAFHPAQLDKRARKMDWAAWLPPGAQVKVEVSTNRKSKIYHAGAAQTRIEGALDAAGYQTQGDDAVALKVRIDDNRVTLSLDTSGAPLHKRGHKQAVGKAPLRETMAAAFLAQCGFDGTQPVYDPMCGSGTFPIEAAEMAAKLQPGRARKFAFQDFPGFDPEVFASLRYTPATFGPARFSGSDRDTGVIDMATENAKRAGVETLCAFHSMDLRDARPPQGPPGLVMLNPPYGARIGTKRALYSVYAGIGAVLRSKFAGWRVGLVTSEKSLAQATDLPWAPTAKPVSHGGLRVTLYQAQL
ncbi:MAG: class I SAM-dependent RNA methyltransferase [Pseudomonadota bacterium]